MGQICKAIVSQNKELNWEGTREVENSFEMYFEDSWFFLLTWEPREGIPQYLRRTIRGVRRIPWEFPVEGAGWGVCVQGALPWAYSSGIRQRRCRKPDIVGSELRQTALRPHMLCFVWPPEGRNQFYQNLDLEKPCAKTKETQTHTSAPSSGNSPNGRTDMSPSNRWIQTLTKSSIGNMMQWIFLKKAFFFQKLFLQFNLPLSAITRSSLDVYCEEPEASPSTGTQLQPSHPPKTRKKVLHYWCFPISYSSYSIPTQSCGSTILVCNRRGSS